MTGNDQPKAGDSGSDTESAGNDLTELAHLSMPFAAAIGLRDMFGDASEVRAVADWAADRCTIGGVLHGGYLMALADSVGAMCAALNLPEGAAGTSTIESKTNFLRAATDGEVTVVSTAVHAGRRTIVVQTDVLRADGKLVTRTTQTQSVL